MPTQRDTADYRHDEATRKNNPPAGMVGYEAELREQPQAQYAYDPHLSPQLVWAGKPGLKTVEVEDAAGVEVDTVSLHIHERVSTQAIIAAVQKPQPVQLDLFADPQLPLGEAVEFYQHDVDWANRLVLGDSLLVMNSLLQRELMAGKVQMIYIDPPYGVKFSSNFQPRIDQREVRDRDDDLSREPEQIKAYRDTWTLGIHSYLTYLRDRLRVARELLTDSGSIFVQISDENVHLVRCLMDEVFGAENFVTTISFQTSGSSSANKLEQVFDFILWYGKDASVLKYRKVHQPSEENKNYDRDFVFTESPDGVFQRRMTK
ncbi:MAG: site-specific DNA-methyltransferase, partial [Caldilineales bacterium]|nr:site-specific DNA-methyltransferase [Caldilineales bacterium]